MAKLAIAALCAVAASGCEAIAGRTLGPSRIVCAPFAIDSAATPTPSVSVCWKEGR